MNITLNIVLETFSEYPIINHIPLNENRSYKCAAFMPDDTESLSSDVLYLIDLADPGEAFDTTKGFSYLCICSNSDDGKADVPNGCLLVKGINSLNILARTVQKTFSDLQNWDSALQDIVIKNGSYQDIIDASEKIIGNPLQVLDASYKLLATTLNIRSDDEIDIKLVETGFHSQETLRKIQESGRLKAYREETGIIINHPGNPNKYGTVGRWFWDQGMPVVHILMICKNGSPSPGLIDEFKVLTERCRLCFARNQSQNPQTGRIYDSLVHDLLFGALTDVSEIDERAKVANIPLKGCFTLCKIVLKENNEWLIKRVYSELFQHLPGARIIIHQFEVIVINTYDKELYLTQMKRDEEQIASVISVYDALCGISSPFHRITQMPQAFSQAAKALSLGLKTSEKSVLQNADVDALFIANDKEGIFNYDDILIYHMISASVSSSPDSFTNSTCWNIVKNMWKEDQTDGNDNSQILFTYLVSERKATKTGELLHMHRNNVIYRINKIEEMTGLDLDDYWTRQKLLLAYHWLRLEISNIQE